MIRLFQKSPLAREICLALALKAAAIAVLWALFFTPDHRPATDPAAVADALAPQSGPEPRQ